MNRTSHSFNDSAVSPPLAVIFVPYFGPWPRWMRLYLKSCAFNPSLRWHLIGDAGAPAGMPANVTFQHLSLEAFFKRAGDLLGLNTSGMGAYKVCDFRPAFAELFPEVVAGHAFWGWGDIDVVYGNIQRFVEPLLNDHDVISFMQMPFSNHTCFLRNTPRLTGLFREATGWQADMGNTQHTAFDDHAYTRVIHNEPRVWRQECFATPYLRWYSWLDGSLNFPARWIWSNGRLTASRARAYEFVYFHFMTWKGRRANGETYPCWTDESVFEIHDTPAPGSVESYELTLSGIRPCAPPADRPRRFAMIETLSFPLKWERRVRMAWACFITCDWSRALVNGRLFSAAGWRRFNERFRG